MSVNESTKRRVLSERAGQLSGSAIDEIARLAIQYKAIDLALGAPDFPVATDLKEAAILAIRNDINQYANSWGTKLLRDEIARKVERDLNINIDPETEITVTCGATEAMTLSIATLTNPGDEVIIFEPFFENYNPAVLFSGAIAHRVMLYPPLWHFDKEELASAFGAHTKAIILNTPSNPSGKIFSLDEMNFIADLCLRWDVWCITDEIYEYFVFDGLEHISMRSIKEMSEHTIVIGGMSKSFGITGWRIGYALAPTEITSAIRRMHEITSGGTAAPLQTACIVALQMPSEYYRSLRIENQQRRDHLLHILEPLGFNCYKPQGAFFLMADISNFGLDDLSFTKFLLKEVGVAVVPGSCFYSTPGAGKNMVRFCFAKAAATLLLAEERLAVLAKNYNLR